MARLFNLFHFCVSFCAVVSVIGGEYEKICSNNYIPAVSYRSEGTKNDLYPTPMAQDIVTECVTPNHDQGYCMEIQHCKKLIAQVTNPEAKAFLLASACGPRNQNVYIPKVCCGKYDNYIITNSRTKEVIETEEDIFPKSCGRQNLTFDRRIVGGKEASLGEYPWMVRLMHKSKSGSQTAGCSGFLIHPNFVLTAAHCTHPKRIELMGPVYLAVLGEHNTDTTIDCSSGNLCAKPNQIRRVANVVTHPEYNPEDSAYYNDIALIHLKKAAQISNFVQPICLFKDDSPVPSRYYLSGWGKTEKVLYSQTKMKVEVPSFDQEKCRKKYYLRNILVKDTQICAGGEDEKDSCTGDSGGPLMTVSDDETWYASGVVSFGVGCGMKGWPAIYTNIVQFMPWIQSEMVLNMRNNFKDKRSRLDKEGQYYFL